MVAPLQTIFVPTPLPTARPKGVFIKYTIELTLFGLDIKPRSTDSRDKGNGKQLELVEPRPINTVQVQIDLTMNEVNENAKEKIKSYDEWLHFTSTSLPKK